MKLNFPHNTTRNRARKKIEKLLQDLSRKHGDMVSDLEQEWDDDTLVFAFRAKGMKAKGTLDVTEDEIVLNGRLPLLALPFESRIKQQIEQEGRKLFKA
ncbi:MAG TPA: polyhydroxyalkanoic acid system family protein [Thermoanaerobaculia bacterium]|nr:polyhydroxyalkanoic acid system family protein [Thermoanaerobaculia bacterium]